MYSIQTPAQLCWCYVGGHIAARLRNGSLPCGVYDGLVRHLLEDTCPEDDEIRRVFPRAWAELRDASLRVTMWSMGDYWHNHRTGEATPVLEGVVTQTRIYEGQQWADVTYTRQGIIYTEEKHNFRRLSLVAGTRVHTHDMGIATIV